MLNLTVCCKQSERLNGINEYTIWFLFFQRACNGRNECPSWLLPLIDAEKERVSLTLKMHITPILMQMRYKTCPLFHTRHSGWCFLKEELSPGSKRRPDLDENLSGYKTVKLSDDDLSRLGNSEKGLFRCLKMPHASGELVY